MDNSQWPGLEDEPEKGKSDNTDFSVNADEGGEKLSCNQCDYKSEKVISMKRHITAKHGSARTANLKKRKSMESVKVESRSKEFKMDEDLSDSILNNLQDEFTSTQMGLEQEERIMAALEGGMKEAVDNDDPDEEKEEKEERSPVELEEKLEEERRKNALLQGRVNALEEIKEKQKRNMERMIKIGTDYKAELDKARALKGGADNAKLKKELKEVKALATELQKKVERLTSEKAKAEAEVTRLLKHNDHLEEALGRTKRPDQTQKPSKDCNGSC